MKDVILFGAGQGLENVLKILGQFKQYRVLEIWDNFSFGKSIHHNGEIFIVIKPHTIRKDTLIFIIPERFENEMRKQLTDELDIDSNSIKTWWFCFRQIKKNIIRKYEESLDGQLQTSVDYLKRNELNIFNCELNEKYLHAFKNILIHKDDESGLFYTYWNKKKLYMKRNMSEEQAKDYINSLHMEQDNVSPHCYEQCDEVGRANDVIVDAGAAEGFFSLERIDTAKHIYLVECDKLWIEALEHTFKPYKDKVTVIPKYLSDYDDDTHITIDTIDNFMNPITSIKIDIEGGERAALRGGKRTLLQNRNLTIVACTYHCSEDAKYLSHALLESHFMVSFTDGYMFFPFGEHVISELRHALVVAKKRKKVHVYVWGLGKHYDRLKTTIKKNCIIDGLLDSNPRFVSTVDKDMVKSPEILKIVPFDYVIVTVDNFSSIAETYQEYGLPTEKLICLWDLDGRDYDFIDYNVLRLVKLEYVQEKYRARLKNAPFEYGESHGIVIVDGEILLKEILENKKSLARFGDGEFEIMRMKNRAWFQEATKELSIRLQEVIKSKTDYLCLAIPDNYGKLEKYTEQAADAIREYITSNNTRMETLKFLLPDKTYYDAYVTRPYIIYKERKRAKSIFALWKSIWHNRDILLVEGKTSRMGVGNDLLSNTKSVRRILCPEENAFRVYEKVFEKVLHYANKSDLILISLGPTATILAYDLAKSGYQAIDIGQLDNEYDWWQMQVDRRVEIPGKTVSEVLAGRFPSAVSNVGIEKEILCCVE